MVHKTNTSNCLWRWQGDSLVNKLGMAMEVEGSSRQEGNNTKPKNVIFEIGKLNPKPTYRV